MADPFFVQQQPFAPPPIRRQESAPNLSLPSLSSFTPSSANPVPTAYRDPSLASLATPSTATMYNSTLAPPSTQQSQQTQPSDSQTGEHSASSGEDAKPQAGPNTADSTKAEGRPQATFLTKLYALLERPENHHMIRWDSAGEHIIVERPEQLALHVLPSVYRQSRFASFSRQLNIYGFMRKVNLRNIDSNIDDPDASTWSHPTLRRNSPADVIANFKRRVPPRLPKPRKRPEDAALTSAAPRSAVGMGSHNLPLSVQQQAPRGRARGFSAPGAYSQNPPVWQSATALGQAHTRALPPLAPLSSQADMPLYPGTQMSGGYMGGTLHHQRSHYSLLHPLTPATPEEPHSYNQGYSSQPSAVRDGGSSMFIPNASSTQSSGGYPYQDPSQQFNWSSLPPLNTGAGNSSGSLSSLLNPTGARGGQTSPSYAGAYSGIGANTSPESRPTTGYSVASSSMSSSMHYDGDSEYRPRSSGRPLTPGSMSSTRPGSSQGRPPLPGSMAVPSATQGGSNLSIRRGRRHSQAVSPYPPPFYDTSNDGRPVTAPDTSVHRVRSFGHLPPVQDSLGEDGASAVRNGQGPFMGFNSSQGDFAYNAGNSTPGIDTIDNSWMGDPTGAHSGQAGGLAAPQRPGTAASSMSTHSSTSATQTPPVMDGGFGSHNADINRFSPDFGFLAATPHAQVAAHPVLLAGADKSDG